MAKIQKIGATEEIADIIKNCENMKNRSTTLIINEVKNIYVFFDEMVEVPRMSVKKIEYNEIINFLRDVSIIVPEYFSGFSLLQIQKPIAECHHLQFVKKVTSGEKDFIHMIKIDLRFSSDMGTNYRGGTADFYPSYETNHLLFSSVLIPVISIEYNGDEIVDFVPTRIFGKESVLSDMKMFLGHTLFDEFDPTVINEAISKEIPQSILPFSLRVYPFFTYDYFTICMNIPDPKSAKIQSGADIFAPFFEKASSMIVTKDFSNAVQRYPEYLTASGSGVDFTNAFISQATNYLAKYSLFQDEPLALKRWRRLDVAE